MTTDKTPEEAAEEYAEEHYISCIVNEPHANMLFAKELSEQSFLAGWQACLNQQNTDEAKKTNDLTYTQKVCSVFDLSDQRQTVEEFNRSLQLVKDRLANVDKQFIDLKQGEK
jgi:hypothetical protein